MVKRLRRLALVNLRPAAALGSAAQLAESHFERVTLLRARLGFGLRLGLGFGLGSAAATALFDWGCQFIKRGQFIEADRRRGLRFVHTRVDVREGRLRLDRLRGSRGPGAATPARRRRVLSGRRFDRVALHGDLAGLSDLIGRKPVTGNALFGVVGRRLVGVRQCLRLLGGRLSFGPGLRLKDLGHVQRDLLLDLGVGLGPPERPVRASPRAPEGRPGGWRTCDGGAARPARSPSRRTCGVGVSVSSMCSPSAA